MWTDLKVFGELFSDFFAQLPAIVYIFECIAINQDRFNKSLSIFETRLTSSLGSLHFDRLLYGYIVNRKSIFLFSLKVDLNVGMIFL